ncbi:PREDICTED: phospholipase A1-like [Polistes dominula]|uniref:phospholipase A1 n=1 Tax=Polistes dominula TaxID=743375 RepID=A0ABM1J3T2_POLDO|nr:PREDICTED: phospholipase A1-like [Polistes dominula]
MKISAFPYVRKRSKLKKMNLKYLILLICFVQVLHYCNAADNSSFVESERLIPNCKFSVDNVGFILYTRENPKGVYVKEKNLTSYDPFNKARLSRPVIFIIHGFLSAPNDTILKNLAKALIEKNDFLVLSLDWKKGACDGGLSPLDYVAYPKAVENTRSAGKYVAEFTKMLVEKYKVSMSNIRIIGHSLGAHVSGFAGKYVQKIHLGKYSEIIGLDPAGPLFRWNKCPNRICETDAEYVQILHTSKLKGTTTRLGTIDFYINYGRDQPGCGILNESCSHARAVEYFTECVKHQCCLIGTPWNNYWIVKPFSQCTKKTCVCVGLNAKKYASRGSFYVPVEANPPYCHTEGLKLEL